MQKQELHQVQQKEQQISLKEYFLDNLSTKVNFKNNECIAIGYIEKGKEAQIKEKNTLILILNMNL